MCHVSGVMFHMSRVIYLLFLPNLTHLFHLYLKITEKGQTIVRDSYNMILDDTRKKHLIHCFPIEIA